MTRLAALAAVWLAFVLPGDRVVGLLAESRANGQPLRVEGKLSSRDSSAPERLTIEIHPELGARIADDEGGRWLVANGKATAGTKLPPPSWVLDLAPLVLRHEGELRGWLAAEGVDVGKNELARCGAGDCWVLGTRQAAAQAWIEKSAFELRRIVRPGLPARVFDEWQLFGKIRFPARIELSDDSGALTALAVESVTAIPLTAADLTAAWVSAPPAAKTR